MKKLLILLALTLGLVSTARAKDPAELWDLNALKVAPQAEWSEIQTVAQGDVNVELQTVYYKAEPFGGHETRVMAFVAKPVGDGPFPGMVLVHGGGGTAFKDWALLWAKNGYAAIAMDLAGCEVLPDGSRKPLADGGPGQNDDQKFGDFNEKDYRKMWSYHAIADIMLANSLLAAQPYVDANRIGATGISWGGYLTTMVSGIDDRFKVIVPVYGCGNLDKNSCWTPRIQKLSWPVYLLWNEYFDPIRYCGRARCPMFFVAGTDDFAYPLDIHYDNYARVPNADVRLQVHMPHGHEVGWAPKEILAYVNHVLCGGPALPCLEKIQWKRQDDGTLLVSAHVKYGVKPTSATLHYSTDRGGYRDGKWDIREWKDFPAQISGENSETVSAVLPADIAALNPLRFFLSVEDEAGNMVSSHYGFVRAIAHPNFAPVPDGGTLLFGLDADGQLVNRFLSKNGEPSNWKVEDNTLISTMGDGPNSIHSEVDFRDAQIHVEFQLPATGSGNSGIYIHGNYEMQILNSNNERDVHFFNAGALYRFYPPITQALLPAGEWQSYDITYTAPRRDESGKIVTPGRVTAYLNGILVQENAEFYEPVSQWHPFRHGNTPFLDAKYAHQKATGFGPVFLQDHENPVRFRNVWVKPIAE